MESGPLVANVKLRFSVPAERVFDAWLDPKMIGQWMFGPAVREEEILHLEIDPKVGGKFSFLVRRGDQEIDHVGEYLKLERPRGLAFTWGIKGSDTSFVVVGITPLDSGCELTLVHEIHPEWADYVERTKEGWVKMLGALAKLLS